VQDNDEHYMVADHDGSPAPYPWFQPLQPYIKSAQVFRCPSLQESATDFTLPDTRPASDYIVNGFFAHGVHQAVFNQASLQIMVVEREKGKDVLDYHPWVADGPEWENISQERHLGGSNYLFVDGHAKWFKWERTLLPATALDPDGVTVVGMHNIEGKEEPVH